MSVLDLGGAPADWIPHGGRPARCLGYRHGMPSYERDDGVVVFDFLLAEVNTLHVRFYSLWYHAACALAPDGLVPLWARGNPKAGLVERLAGHPRLVEAARRGVPANWRPWLYRKQQVRFQLAHEWVGIGSQGELDWRTVTNAKLKKSTVGEELPDWDDALRRARRLLQENLSPLQRIELAGCGCFRVRGGLTGNVYSIQLGNGFALVDKGTTYEIASYCFHPEYWMPDEDVALATKFLLEDPDLEVECLETAKMSPKTLLKRGPTRFERYARDIERELIV